MIQELVVRDLGIFAEAHLGLGEGFTVLTGETGAGKSLLVGAVQLLLGARADAGVVRPGAAEATVDGRFVDGAGEEIVLSRVVPADGRSRAYCNGRPVTVTELAELGTELVELHGQHAHQQLLRASAQRDALDRFGGVDLGPLERARAEIADTLAQLDSLGGDDRTRARELDLLRYQLDELEQAALEDPNEDRALDAEEDVLADAAHHREAAATVASALSGDDGIGDQLQTLIGEVSGRAPFTHVEPTLRAAAAELSDAASELRSLAETITDDPERLEAIRERRQLLADLRRKYGDTLEEVMAEREAIRERLTELDQHDERAAELDERLQRARRDEAAAAAVVAKARRAAAPALAGGVQERLRTMAMPDAVVEVEVAGDDPADEVRFLLSANPGNPAQPVAKVASGGELSRTTLALRLELTAGPPALIFDEVDAGIGGETAWAVAAALGALSSRHQIVVVTHLPQVAAFADTQLRISKSTDADVATGRVDPLDDEDRLVELARMLSGQPDSSVGRDHAVELLERAASERGRR